jgi:hypothetical protein
MAGVTSIIVKESLDEIGKRLSQASKPILTTKKLHDDDKCHLGTLLCLNLSQIGMRGFEPPTPASRKQ